MKKMAISEFKAHALNVLAQVANSKEPAQYDELLLSAISPWEFLKLLEKKQIYMSQDPSHWLDTALDMVKFRLIPLSPIIAYKSKMLPPTFHNDPADQIIVASARQENATVITADDRIRSYDHVHTLW